MDEFLSDIAPTMAQPSKGIVTSNVLDVEDDDNEDIENQGVKTLSIEGRNKARIIPM